MWNQQRLEQMIADGVEESLTLDYKAAGAFAKDQPKRKEEIQKDVSAFANSAGGKIIYGIKEHSSPDKKHLPERIDPIARDQFSKEWLEQIISGIQPRIQGVIIHPVQLTSSPNDSCYVVEIPQSETVHQAPDGKYYRRYNFENRFMQDYEVREAMNRARHPKLDIKVRLNLKSAGSDNNLFLVEITNTGRSIAKYFMCNVMLPLYANGKAVRPVDPVVISNQADADNNYSLRFTLPELQDRPLFPGSSIIIQKKIDVSGGGNDSGWTDIKAGTPTPSADSITAVLYADEMEPLKRVVPLDQAISRWA